jgi:hypothetical protein
MSLDGEIGIDGRNWSEVGFSFIKNSGVQDDLSAPGRTYRPHIVGAGGLIKRRSSSKVTFCAMRASDALLASSKVTKA